jgi:hypothetical protein
LTHSDLVGIDFIFLYFVHLRWQVRFTGLLKDLFPSAQQGGNLNAELLQAVKEVFAELKLSYTDVQVCLEAAFFAIFYFV